MDNNLVFNDPRPSRSDALQNRILLLETAKRLFEEQGVEAVSMSAIAQAAGVGKGTLYRHFENKTELCYALLDEDQRQLQERTFAQIRQEPDPLINLRWFLVEIVAFVERNCALIGVKSLETDSRSLAHPAHSWWRHTIFKLLERLNPPGDISYMADVLYVMVDVHTLAFQRRVLGYNTQRITDGLFSTLLKFIS